MNATSTFTARRLVGLFTVTTLALIACGSDETVAPTNSAGGSAGATSVPAPSTTTEPADGGWIDGEPDWTGADPMDDGGEFAESESLDLEDGADIAGSSGGREESSVAEEPASEAVDADVALAEPGGDVLPVPAPSNEPLRAGSVDDGVDFDGFLAYLDRVTSAGFTARNADLRGRVVVSVVDESGRPVPGIAVTARSADGGEAARDALTIEGRTTADGTVRLFPALHGLDPASPLTVELADGSGEPVVADAGGSVSLTSPTVSITDPVPLDVLFLLDATGSMGDEIDRLKTTIDLVADRVNQLDPRPDVRFAMTLYRDEGDAFLTSTFDFASDVDVFRDALAEVVADGGGDTPEALDEGLAEALAAPAWRDPADAVQLVFLVADAPPQVNRQVDTPYTASIRTAIERGIKIFPIASSNSDDVAELVFRQLAVTTGAPFVFLSYGAGGAATGGSTDIDRTDYEELALDELVVRLIAEELADLTGGETTPAPPTTIAPSTTNPDGQ